jgi:hypothetical protein
MVLWTLAHARDVATAVGAVLCVLIPVCLMCVLCVTIVRTVVVLGKRAFRVLGNDFPGVLAPIVLAAATAVAPGAAVGVLIAVIAVCFLLVPVVVMGAVTIVVLAVEAVFVLPWISKHRRPSARQRMAKREAALNGKKRLDRHKGQTRRKRGKKWTAEHWDDRGPSVVRVSVTHPAAGPFRFQTTFRVTGTIRDFVEATGLSTAHTRTSHSRRTLNPELTFSDYGFMPGSVIELQATFLRPGWSGGGLLGGAPCGQRTSRGYPCEQFSVAGGPCEEHTAPLAAIVQLGELCDRLYEADTLPALHTHAAQLLVQLNALGVPDQPQFREPFLQLRSQRRTELGQALLPREGTPFHIVRDISCLMRHW